MRGKLSAQYESFNPSILQVPWCTLRKYTQGEDKTGKSSQSHHFYRRMCNQVKLCFHFLWKRGHALITWTVQIRVPSFCINDPNGNAIFKQFMMLYVFNRFSPIPRCASSTIHTHSYLQSIYQCLMASSYCREQRVAHTNYIRPSPIHSKGKSAMYFGSLVGFGASCLVLPLRKSH